VVYQLSCGALDPAEVEPEPLVEGLIAGQRVELHALRGVEPNVVLAIRPLTCDGPLDLGPEAFHLAFQHDAAFDDHGPSDPFNEAMCRAALFGTDPAEGFRCPERPQVRQRSLDDAEPRFSARRASDISRYTRVDAAL
jgi:hypothetical protein